MNTNVRNAAKSRKFFFARVIKNSIYPAPVVTVKISKRYSPRHQLLSEEIRLQKVQPVADRPNDVIRHPVRREERAEEIR